MTDCTRNDRFPAGRLLFGLGLLGLGGAALLDRIDLVEFGTLWEYWPLILVGVGLVNEIDALVARRGDGGFVLMAVGAWFTARQELFGIDRGMAFPLAAIIVGAGLAIHALIDRPVTEAKETDRGNC